MIDLNKIIINFDFFHCIERDGFVFTSIDEPANILDAIVIRCPENSVSITPQKSFSKKTLGEHIELINKYKLEKACVIAENIDFISQCPSLKYLQIIPSKSTPNIFDYSPLYSMPEIRYLTATTEYGDHHNPTITTIDYSYINGLKEVWISGKGHLNINKLNNVVILNVYEQSLPCFNEMGCHESLRRLDLMKTGIYSLNGISNFKYLQWLSLDYERRLIDMNEIITIANTLQSLSIENCPKILDFSFLNHLSNLEHHYLLLK